MYCRWFTTQCNELSWLTIVYLLLPLLQHHQLVVHKIHSCTRWYLLFSISRETKKSYSKASLPAEAFCTVICNPYYITTTYPREFLRFFFFGLYVCTSASETVTQELLHPAANKPCNTFPSLSFGADWRRKRMWALNTNSQTNNKKSLH